MYIQFPSNNSIRKYDTFSDFPSLAANGTLALALDTDFLYAFNTNTASWVQIGASSDALEIGTIDSTAPSANGAVITLNDLILQSASATFPGLVNLTAQSFAGDKTFVNNISAANLSGTNTGNVTLGTANGLSLVGQALSLALSSGSTIGALSSTDWTTFNNKQAAGNYITSLTSDVTASGPGAAAATIANNVVTNAKLAQMSAHTFKGNNTGSTANALDLTATQLTAELNAFVGDSGSGGTKGLVPAPSTGDSVKVLKGDGTWTTPGLYTIVTKTTTYTAATSDNVILVDTSGGAWTLSLYTAVGNSGRQLRIRKTTNDFNALTVDPNGSETIAENGTTTTTSTLNTVDEELTIVSDGSNWIVLNRETETAVQSISITGAWNTNTTYTSKWWRVRNYMHWDVAIALSGAPNAAQLTLNMPVTIDTAKLAAGTESANISFGSGTAKDQGNGSYHAAVQYETTTTVKIEALTLVSTTLLYDNITATVPFAFGNTDRIYVRFSFPVSGWK